MEIIKKVMYLLMGPLSPEEFRTRLFLKTMYLHFEITKLNLITGKLSKVQTDTLKVHFN